MAKYVQGKKDTGKECIMNLWLNPSVAIQRDIKIEVSDFINVEFSFPLLLCDYVYCLQKIAIIVRVCGEIEIFEMKPIRSLSAPTHTFVVGCSLGLRVMRPTYHRREVEPKNRIRASCNAVCHCFAIWNRVKVGDWRRLAGHLQSSDVRQSVMLINY